MRHETHVSVVSFNNAMPKRKRLFGRRRRFTRRAGRKTYKRRRFTAKRTPRGWKPFGNTRVAKLTYCDNISLDAGVDTLASRRFRCNGLWDPDVALGGHQPYGFDQLAAVFNRYLVLGAKITITPMVNGAGGPGTGQALGIAIKLSDRDTLLSTTPTVIQEQPGYKYKLFSNSAVTGRMSLSMGFSPRKVIGKKFMWDGQYQGTVGTDPGDQWYWHVIYFSPIPTTQPPEMTFNVRIDYVARFMSPVELNSST